jgi:hypothetical protein
MTLGQLILLVLVVVVFWLGKKSKKQETKINELEKKLEKR